MLSNRSSRNIARFLVAYPLFQSSQSACYSSASQKVLNNDIVLYQYAICPFCHRVRAYLDYNGISYNTVEVNALTKKQLSFSTETKKVPVMVIDGATVGDSAAIVAHIEKLLVVSEKNAANIASPEDTAKWTKWSEEKLAVMLYPNITRNFKESWQMFGYTKDVSSWDLFSRVTNRTIGPIAMYFANGRIKKKYGIVDERQELKVLLEEWTTAVGGKKYFHGDHISMPDLMVFGVLHAIEGFDTFDEIMSSSTSLSDWYSRVAEELNHRRHQPHQ